MASAVAFNQLVDGYHKIQWEGKVDQSINKKEIEKRRERETDRSK